MNAATFFAKDTIQILFVKNRLEAFLSTPEKSHSKAVRHFAETVVRIHLCEDVEVLDEHTHAYNCIYSHNARNGVPIKKYREMTMLTNPEHIEGMNIAWKIICPNNERASQL